MENKVPTKPTSSPALPTAHQQLFIATLTSLTWQLVIVVLVPIIGGHFVDQAAKSTPRWTFVGLGLAALLAGLCLFNGYKLVTREAAEDTKK